MAVLTALLGLFPGLVLLLAEPALRALTGSGLEGRASPLAVSTVIGGRGYSALALALLLGVVALLTFLGVRRWTVPGFRRGPAWNCGFAASPPWLPFGDPATQYSGGSFAQPLRRTLGSSVLAAAERVEMPAPGDTRPASYIAEAEDPAFTWLFGPMRQVREWLAVQAERLQFLTIRRTLALMFTALVLFLSIVAWLQAP
ncbi:MAG: hypothetical protein JOZ17_05820 [Acetobacteraceae bacterium]|nr:hypothetical protein [Acetobacteraceae bacterium]